MSEQGKVCVRGGGEWGGNPMLFVHRWKLSIFLAKIVLTKWFQLIKNGFEFLLKPVSLGVRIASYDSACNLELNFSDVLPLISIRFWGGLSSSDNQVLNL